MQDGVLYQQSTSEIGGGKDERIKYPEGMGITGEIALSGGIFTSSLIKKEPKYVQEIDNCTNLIDLNNMMFGALTGSRG